MIGSSIISKMWELGEVGVRDAVIIVQFNEIEIKKILK